MRLSEAPPKFFIPFAQRAGHDFIRAIPQLSQIGLEDGAASFSDGFPPLTFIPLHMGGVAPFGQDFNGIFNQITAWLRQYQAGWPIYYDQAFCDSIQGYPKGAFVQSSTEVGIFWISLIDDNTQDPNVDPALCLDLAEKWFRFPDPHVGGNGANIEIPYAVDTSTVPNIINVDFGTLFDCPKAGDVVAVKKNNTNTGPITLQITHLGVSLPPAKLVPVGGGGADAKIRDIKKGDVNIFVYDGEKWWFVPVGLSDAPWDDTTYGRCDGEWVPVPMVLKGAIDFWVRWDGNDVTGDGTANTPEKAFRTIEGCWTAVGFRYAGSPSAAINIRLGIPGDYEGANIGPFGSTVQIIGDVNAAQSYRILTKTYGFTGDRVDMAWSVRIAGINICNLIGINMVMTYPGLSWNGTQCLRVPGSTCVPISCYFTLEASNSEGHVIVIEERGYMMSINANVVEGNGNTITSGYFVGQGSQFPGCPAPNTATWYWSNIVFTAAGYCVADNSYIDHIQTNTVINNVVGPRWIADTFAVLRFRGNQGPGNQAGSTSPIAAVSM